MPDSLVEVENAGKKFCRDLKKSLWYGVKDSVNDLLNKDSNPRLRVDEFWANKEISFQLNRGECLGLLGRNGAGKTTLLKMLNGLIKPDSGSITIRGRVGAMIALNAGFNPILTGRENILINGSILGQSRRQLADKLDEIVAFAEIDKFIDSPVRTYSSGMNVRLGFAVATILVNPDVLLLDEVLAVGDSAFRAKCLNRISDKLANSAVIFVSHSDEQIRRICTRALLLERGLVKYASTNVSEALAFYENESTTHHSQHEISWETPGCDILEISVSPAETTNLRLTENSEITIKALIKPYRRVENPTFHLLVRSNNGTVTLCLESDANQSLKANQTIEFNFSATLPGLLTGPYTLGFGLNDQQNNQIVLRTQNLCSGLVTTTSLYQVTQKARLTLTTQELA